MYKLIVITLLVASSLSGLSSSAFAISVDTAEELSVTLENLRSQHDIPAMAVAVIEAGEVVYVKGFGFLDDLKTKPTTTTSLFRIASISKLFTAQAVMQLVEQNKLGLDDTIGQYLPIFQNSKITIRQLLTHSSGLKDTIKPEKFESLRFHQAYLDLVQKSVSNKLERKKFEYSDTGFNVLGNIISAVSGVKFEKYIGENILIPAGMRRSGYFDGANKFIAEAPPTHNGKLIEKEEQRPYDLSFNPSEGLVSSVVDLSQWLRLTLAHDTSILQQETYTKMLEPQIKTEWGEIYIGLGWQVYHSDGVSVARHPGSIRGYKSLLVSYPESKNAMILLTNSSEAPRWDIAKSITKILKRQGEWQ